MKTSSHHHESERGAGAAHGTETPDVSHIKNEDVTHEESDVDVGAILWFVVGVSVFTIISFALMFLLFEFFERREVAAEPAQDPMALVGKDKLPPGPRLQLAPGSETHPLDDLKVLREQEEADLKGYGLIDQATGTVSLPIEQAKRKFLEGNPPVRAGQDGSQLNNNGMGIDLPSYYSSGRTTEKRRQ